MLNKSPNNNLKKNPPELQDLTPQVEEMGFQINEEIDRLEEILLDNHIPILNKIIINENTLINQLDLIRINIPDSLEQALEILNKKEEIISDAQQYAQTIIENSRKRASQILDETKIIQQAEMQANQLRRQVQQECENLQRKTLNEVEQRRRKAQQEISQMQQKGKEESEYIQKEADDYADAALSHLEQKLGDMLNIVRNGRKQINSNLPSSKKYNDNGNQKKVS